MNNSHMFTIDRELLPCNKLIPLQLHYILVIWSYETVKKLNALLT